MSTVEHPPAAMRSRTFSWQNPAATAEGRVFAQDGEKLIAHGSTGCVILG